MVAGLLLAGGGLGVGVFGSLLGLGGGILIVPLLVTGFGLPFREAVGVSLVCVVVTSSAAAGVYLERHVANLRLGMLLEVFTAGGALLGGLVAFLLPERALAGLFAALLAYTALTMLRGRRRGQGPVDDRGAAASVVGAAASVVVAAAVPAATTADRGVTGAPDPPAGEQMAVAPSIDGDPAQTFVDRLAGPGYRPHHLGIGVAGGVVAGVVSALLGVGGGIVKVPLMYLVMGVPLKVATATSNLMIGVTGTASAVVYLARGDIDPLVAGPTAVGVFAGALVGARLAPRIDLRVLRLLFIVVLGLNAVQMLLRALT